MPDQTPYVDNEPKTPQVLEVEGVLLYGYRPAPAPLQETVRAHTVEGFILYVRSKRLRSRGTSRCTQARYRLLLTKYGQNNLTKEQQAELPIGKFINI